ncbi:N,N-dimethylformamidase beta subunit family domain-containing protein, partial [Mesorhizobium sp. 128a]
MAKREWVLVRASFDADQSRLELHQRSLPEGANKPVTRQIAEVLPKGSFVVDTAEFLIAARQARSEAGERLETEHHFNGKIEAPALLNCAPRAEELKALVPAALSKPRREDVVGAWDFSLEQSSDQIKDSSANQLHGRLVNMPTRAMKGHRWSGNSHDWGACPEEYGAIHFHEDDLYDAEWSDDFSFTIPESLKSGVYAARLEGTDVSPSYVIFFVRPPRGEAQSDIVYLASTATYMAYANQHVLSRDRFYETGMGALPIITDEDIFLQAHPEFGKSLYDHHTDGSGVCYSSRLRPILNMAPNSRHWTFSGDGYLTAWLDAMGTKVDVITDEDLHREGEELLRPYRVVLTGCHPEYVSLPMWNALETHLTRAGRLMYLGGNGFYWRTAFHPTMEGLIEVRRAEDGSRTWAAEPGEYYMSSTGEYGGLWRRQDRT